VKIILRLIKNLGKIAVGTVVCVLLLEAGVRITYRVRNSRVVVVPIPYMMRNTGLVPPWMDGVRILDRDDTLMFRGRPNAHLKYLDLFCPMPSEEARKAMLRRFQPSIPTEFKNNPTWEISLNSEGFRDLEFPANKPAQTLRIVSLGDSWTFGHNVNRDDSYPQRLRALLTTQLPNSKIEVLNLGMLNFTSHEGLALLKSRALGLDPDIVLIGFGMNDAAISGWRDKDVLVVRPKAFKLKRFILENSELYRLLTYIGQVGKFEAVSMSEQLKAIADPNAGFLYESWVSAEALEAKDYERLEGRVRVSPADYETNIREMIKLVRAHGATPILLHNELRPGSPFQAALRRISQEENVPLVDICELLFAAKGRIEAELQQRLGLQPSLVTTDDKHAGAGEVVFRVFAGNYPVKTSMFITGPYSQMGDATPNTIAMYDDGTHGDEKAGDQVWSLAVKFSPRQKIFYVYTNSGERGKWQNLDVPKVRSFVVPTAAGRNYLPVETFGQLYLQADGFHTNARGYELMAQAVRDAVVKTDKFRSFAGR
jgi:lysophospholipase L1-like esterase